VATVPKTLFTRPYVGTKRCKQVYSMELISQERGPSAVVFPYIFTFASHQYFTRFEREGNTTVLADLYKPAAAKSLGLTIPFQPSYGTLDRRTKACKYAQLLSDGYEATDRLPLSI
jgi:hypothetical protein